MYLLEVSASRNRLLIILPAYEAVPKCKTNFSIQSMSIPDILTPFGSSLRLVYEALRLILSLWCFIAIEST